MAYDIFFSYSHKDSGIARGYKKSFEKAGLKCFLAETDIPAGAPWSERVREAILVSKKMVFLITPRSKDSLWIAAEAGAGWILEKELIAALMFVEAKDLIDPIRSCQARMVESIEQTEELIKELISLNSMQHVAGASVNRSVEVMSEYSIIEPQAINSASKSVTRGVASKVDSKKWYVKRYMDIVRGKTNRSYQENCFVSFAGSWQELNREDTTFYKQIGNRVVGFYNYGVRKGKVGVKFGVINNNILEYSWEWLNGQFQGSGRQNLNETGDEIIGKWW